MTDTTASVAGGIMIRVLAAGPGGYLLSMIACIWLLDLLQLEQRNGRLLVNMLFFVIYLLVILWVFATRSTRTAVLGVALPTLGLFALHWLQHGALS